MKADQVQAEPGHKRSSGPFVPGEGPGHWPGAACKAGRGTVVHRMMAAVQQVVASGTGVLLIEQFVALALGVATHACVLEHGRIAWAGLAGELRRRPDILHGSYLAMARDTAAS